MDIYNTERQSLEKAYEHVRMEFDSIFAIMIQIIQESSLSEAQKIACMHQAHFRLQTYMSYTGTLPNPAPDPFEWLTQQI